MILNYFIQAPSVNAGYQFGYKVGYVIAKVLPIIILLVLIYLGFRYFRLKSKK